jgi:hypothetical protein
MKALLNIVLVAITALFVTTAFGHGDAKPKQGGVVSSAGDITFELVAGPEGATLYLEDHGKPLASAGMSGKLTVLSGADKAEGELKPAGENKLLAAGIKLNAGARVVATITRGESKKAITVRFALK